jgi:hypothetical protein
MSKKMSKLRGQWIAVGAVLGGLALSQPVHVAAQAKPAGRPAATSKAKFTPRRLPWGDPDISGNFTTKDELNTPMERPEQFAGRRIEDVGAEELAKIAAQRQLNAVESAPFITGSRADGIAIGVPIHWLEHLDSASSRPWLVIDPPDGRIPPRSEESKKRPPQVTGGGPSVIPGRSVADSYTDRGLQDRCILNRGLNMVGGVYGASYQILQTKDYVAMRYEMIHETRIIPIKGRAMERAHPPQGMRGYIGDSIGWWEGDTFVVETTNFSNETNYRGVRALNLRLVERFTRTAPNKVEATVTINNSAEYTRPWTYSIPLTEDDTQAIFEYACHEGNYGLRNILTGAREDQRRGIEPSNGPALPPEQQE